MTLFPISWNLLCREDAWHQLCDCAFRLCSDLEVQQSRQSVQTLSCVISNSSVRPEAQKIHEIWMAWYGNAVTVKQVPFAMLCYAALCYAVPHAKGKRHRGYANVAS